MWDEEFSFDVTTEKEVAIEIYDKEHVGGDKFMGRAQLNLLDLIAQEDFHGSVVVLDKCGHHAGELMVKAKFTKTGSEESRRDMSKPTELNGIKNEFTDSEILEAFLSFDLDKNNYVGAAEIRHVLVNIGESASDEEVGSYFMTNARTRGESRHWN